MNELRFAWWNVQDFGHYAPERAGLNRWPECADAYLEKSKRVDAALKRLIELKGCPHILGLAEITAVAATELRDRLFPGFEVYSMDSAPRAEFQIAFLFDSSLPIQKVKPIHVPDVPSTTRPIAAIDLICDGNRLRVYATHWTAPIRNESKTTRQSIARHLAHCVYDFMRDKSFPEAKHVVIMGDLNEEPFGLPEVDLHGSRSRDQAKQKEHHKDKDVRRQRLYNCSWRMIGESVPHSSEPEHGVAGCAGTYYKRDKLSWHTVDQILVSGTLLTSERPMLDEASLCVLSDREFLHTDGRPGKFNGDSPENCGVSDHLPLVGKVLL